MFENDWEKFKEEIEPRIDRLSECKQYLEMISFFSCILEKEILETLTLYEILSKLALNRNGVKFLPGKLINKEKSTLGKLTNYLSVYNDDKKLQVDIEKFNKVRIKVIHKLFDHDVSKLEIEIMQYEPDFYRLLMRLNDLKLKLIEKLPK